jgi:hypothetical protein
VGEKALKRFSLATAIAIVSAFLTGLLFHVLYQRWSSPIEMEDVAPALTSMSQNGVTGPPSYRVTFVPFSSPVPSQAELPLLQVRDVEKIRAVAGKQARIRGRVFRVGQSAKSNTYFLNFGPSREALTAVIFASAAELFEKKKVSPKTFEGKEVELQGEIKDHPQYGLEIILENPSQIRVID